MNTRNVESLRDILREAPRRVWANAESEMAAWLASRGVLVPSVLTDEEHEDMVAASWRAVEEAGASDIDLRAWLESIAKG